MSVLWNKACATIAITSCIQPRTPRMKFGKSRHVKDFRQPALKSSKFTCHICPFQILEMQDKALLKSLRGQTSASVLMYAHEASGYRIRTLNLAAAASANSSNAVLVAFEKVTNLRQLASTV